MKFTAHDQQHHGSPISNQDWPLVLTPELRQQLIQEKVRRVREFVRLRDQPTHTCRETSCECN
jgi:hypothetical protein